MVTVFPFLKIKAESKSFPILDLNSAFNNQTSNYLVPYYTQGKSEQKKHKKTSQSMVHTVFDTIWFDIDLPDHRAWKDQGEIYDKISWLEGLKLPEGWRFYSTAHGYRLYWVLYEPRPTLVYTSLHSQMSSVLVEKGVPVDGQCKDWTRVYALPKKEAIHHETEGYLDWSSALPLQEEIIPGETDVCTFELDLDVKRPAQKEYQELYGFAATLWTQLYHGEPIAEPGYRNPTLVKLIWSLIQQVDDPWPFIARSTIKMGKEYEAQDITRRAYEKLKQEKQDDTPKFLIHGKSFYVYHRLQKEYAHKDTLELPKALIAAGLRPQQVIKKNGYPHSIAYLAYHFGEGVRNVIYTIGAKNHRYDPEEGGTLYLPSCKLKDYPPEYNEEIDQWLELLGGDHPNKLRDWIACFPMFDAPNVLLYLHGRNAVGKGLLGHGLSTWIGGRTEFQTILSDWNTSLLNSPFVVLDEGVSGKQYLPTETFRNMIAEGEREIRIKHRNNVTQHGYLRFAVFANNEDALRVREQMSAYDAAAVNERILYLHCKEEAAKYLKSLGGMAYTLPNWGKSGALVRHFAWLHHNQPVPPTPDRFLIEAPITRFHRKLATSTNNVVLTLSCIAKALNVDQPKPGIFFKDGHCCVNAARLHEYWGVVMSGPSPGNRQIAKILKNQSADGKQHKLKHTQMKPRYNVYKIPLDRVQFATDELQLFTEEEWDTILKKRCSEEEWLKRNS